MNIRSAKTVNLRKRGVSISTPLLNDYLLFMTKFRNIISIFFGIIVEDNEPLDGLTYLISKILR